MFGNSIYRELPRHPQQLPQPIVLLAAKLFADTSSGMSGARIFEFFSRYSDELGKMRYGSGAPTKRIFFVNFLESLPAEQQKQALMELCDQETSRWYSATPDDIAKLRGLLGGVPVPQSFGVTVLKIDVAYVTEAWNKAVERLRDDPKGAITSARTLLETVYLHILRELNAEFDAKGDLGLLHKRTFQVLDVVNVFESEAVAQVVGSCGGVVGGIAAMRNQFGDAHGTFHSQVERPLAHLCVNAAGTMAIFAVETLRHRQSQISPIR